MSGDGKVSEGLLSLRDALIEGTGWPLDEVEALLESEPVQLALTLIKRESFDRASSPAVGPLLAEIQLLGPGKFRNGLERAVELLIEGWADNFHEAYKRGVRDGWAQSVNQKRLSESLSGETEDRP